MERKKIIIVAAVLVLGIVAWRMGAMEQGEQAQAGQEMVTVWQKDAAGNEVSIEVPWDQLQHFGMFRDMRSRVEISGSSINNRLPLVSAVSMDIFKALLADNAARRIVKTMPAVEFNKEALELLIVRLNAANFLQHAALIEQYSRQIADMIMSDASMSLLSQSDQTYSAFIMALIAELSSNLQRHILVYIPAEMWIEQHTIAHDKKVNSVAISADGNRVVTGSEDNIAKITVWNGSAWVEDRIRHEGAAVLSVAISADGNRMVTGSDENTVNIVTWNGHALVRRDTIAVNLMDLNRNRLNKRVKSVAISADGTRVVAARSGIGGATIFAWYGNVWVEEYESEGVDVRAVAISADGNRVVMGLGSQDKTAKIMAWNGNAWIEQYTIEYTNVVDSVAISADGNRVVTGSWDKTAKIMAWNGNAWIEQYTIAHDRRVLSVAISADGNRVVTGSDYNTAKIVAWNGNAWAEQYTIEYDKKVDLIAISADGNRVVTGSNFTAAKITAWNGNTWGQQYTIAYDGPVFSLAISADGNRVVIGSGETAQIVGLFLSSLPGISDFDTYLFEHLLLWAKRNGQKISQAELKKLIRETVQQ